ncbi:uncharacterized protein LOC114535477 [Dendronephthya gigantea]|uniref:uncharacterized protein LOC114535477 n=1 Tax=Dendronephthya gigantea TaxID=151771 RepID=UPI00106D1662|nr:uncharacterized protein LOC114535477 [Dendronephthya gigantea]
MFCINCGVEGVVNDFCDECSMEQTCEQLITCYFHRGYPYEAIVKLLKRNGFNVSLRTLKRRLSTLGLKRRGNAVRIGRNEVRAAVLKEMEGAGGLSGYRSIWHALRLRHKIHVPRREVADLMKEIDPVGVEERRARKLRRRTFTSAGSNASWHMDGYDKLKPYGFPIHGGIDGFSRKILWLEVSRSNNDPRVAATYYLNQVKEVEGCPLQLVTDCGTENGIAASMQCFFRSRDNDELAGERSHRYCSSPSNQRIEAWWSFLRKHRSSWWINLFKDMIDYDLLDLENGFHIECLWFCFSKVLQNDLDKVKEQWNTHQVTKSQHNNVHGVPDIMYFLPEYHGHNECLVEVSQEKIDEMEQHCHVDDPDESIYHEYFIYVMETEDLSYPNNERESLELYERLVHLQRD